MLRVGLVQINAELSDQSYFPYAAGLLQAYAAANLPDPRAVEFRPPLFQRERIADAVAKLRGADIVGFSLYCWNGRLSLAIAEALKRESPSTLIVCGGPQVPRYDRSWEAEEFLAAHPSVDLIVHQSGEISFLELLKHGLSGKWARVPQASYRLPNGTIHRTLAAPALKSLSQVPDPYTTGVFTPLIAANRGMKWISSVEFDRNCPFNCSFCDWPGVGEGLLLRNEEESYRTIEWFGELGVVYVFVCNANFGIRRERDVAITAKFAEVRLACGYPRSVNLQDGKNVEEWVYRCRKKLFAGGIESPVAMALQSLHPPTLEAIDRMNIKLESYHINQRRYAAEGQTTVTDLILALPEETLESFKRGVGEVIRLGQHNRIFFHSLSMMPGAPMSHPIQREYYGIETVWVRMVNHHGLIADVDEVPEMEEIAIATRTMPREDWVQAKVFAWMTDLLHFDKLLQIPLILCYEVGTAPDDEFAAFWQGIGVNPASFPLSMQLKAGRPRYDELIQLFVSPELDCTDYPLIAEARDFFLARARDIQAGGSLYYPVPEWLGIYWPADQYAFIKLVVEGKLDQFYGEAARLLASRVVINPDLLRQAIQLNHAFFKLPFRSGKQVVDCDWNIFELYRGVLVGRFVGIRPEHHRYHINWSSARWDSMEQWFREVVWWCNRSGEYFLKPRSVAPESIPAGHDY